MLLFHRCEYFIIKNIKVVVPHEYGAGGVFPIVAVWHVGVTLHPRLTVVSDRQVGSGTKDGTMAATQRTHKIRWMSESVHELMSS